VKFQQPFNFTASATASQLLFDGTWLVGLQAAKSYEDLQKKTVNKSEVQLKNEITKAYYLALVSAENMRLLEESKQSLMVTYRETEALYNAGFTEKDNVDQLSLTLNDLTIQAKYAEEQFKLTKDLLKFQIGMPLANDITLSDSAENLMTTDAGALLSSAFQPESTLDVQLAQSGLGMQQLNLRAKKAAYMPSLSTFITFQTTAQRKEFNFFDSSKQYFYGNFWGVQMNVPILSGGRRATAVKKVEVEVKRMEDMLDLAKQGAELEYRSAKAELDNAIQVYNSSKSSVLLASNILKNAQIKFKEGIGTSFDVTQRNTQSIQAQGAYVGAMLKVLNAKTRLAKSLNQL
jgi:outer membrane protein TolC